MTEINRATDITLLFSMRRLYKCSKILKILKTDPRIKYRDMSSSQPIRMWYSVIRRKIIHLAPNSGKLTLDHLILRKLRNSGVRIFSIRRKLSKYLAPNVKKLLAERNRKNQLSRIVRIATKLRKQLPSRNNKVRSTTICKVVTRNDGTVLL